jgi:hypothetical protein
MDISDARDFVIGCQIGSQEVEVILQTPFNISYRFDNGSILPGVTMNLSLLQKQQDQILRYSLCYFGNGSIGLFVAGLNVWNLNTDIGPVSQIYVTTWDGLAVADNIFLTRVSNMKGLDDLDKRDIITTEKAATETETLVDISVSMAIEISSEDISYETQISTRSNESNSKLAMNISMFFIIGLCALITLFAAMGLGFFIIVRKRRKNNSQKANVTHFTSNTTNMSVSTSMASRNPVDLTLINTETYMQQAARRFSMMLSQY